MAVLFHIKMGTKQARGPITWLHKFESFSANVLRAENHRFSYCAGTRLRVQGKTKNLLFHHDVRP